MTVIEKKEAMVNCYHCNDIHAKTCVVSCDFCKRYLRDDLDELEKEIRADERTKVVEEFANKVKALKYRVSKDGGESYYTTQEFCDRDIDEITNELKSTDNETLTDGFDKYVDNQLV